MTTKTYSVSLKANPAVEMRKVNIDIAVCPSRKDKILFRKPLKQDLREAVVITNENNRLLDILGYDTAQKITVAPRTVLAKGTTDAGGAFQYCQNITELDLTEWDISSLNCVSNLCDTCSKLEYIDISNWDMSKINRFAYIFIDCSSLRKIDGVFDLSSCDPSQGFVGMFDGCPNLTGVKLKNLPYDVYAEVPGKKGPFYKIMGFTSTDQFEVVD